jgi:LacI family gluconate utilization system Gnt-I transcriptional repressor
MPAPPIRHRATGRITLADVAEAAGVSPITVSRALRRERARWPPSWWSVSTRRQKPSSATCPTRPRARWPRQRSAHVAVLIPKLSNNLFVDLLEAVQQRLRPPATRR